MPPKNQSCRSFTVPLGESDLEFHELWFILTAFEYYILISQHLFVNLNLLFPRLYIEREKQQCLRCDVWEIKGEVCISLERIVTITTAILIGSG